MLYRAEHLRGYAIQATDGEIGRVDDLLFDDRSWTVRYLVADAGGWLSSRRVLIGTASLEHPDPVGLKLPVTLTREKVQESPSIDADAPVTRQQEELLSRHYGWTPWWTDPAIAVGLLGAEPLAERPLARKREPEPPLGSAAGRAEAALRSAYEVRGFPVAATDGDIGHVDDLLVDEDGWIVRYFIVDTRKWLPGRKVLIAPNWVTGIDWIEEKLAVRMTRENVEGSPEYAPEEQIDRRYEHDLHAWYGHAPYW